MTSSRGPDERESPTSPEAVVDLLASVDACLGRPTCALELVDPVVAASVARRFKLDVSFDFSGARRARFSVNDKGEPEAFRARIGRVLPALGLDPSLLERALSISAAGEVQTTVAVKWDEADGVVPCVSLYFEELGRCPDRERIRRGVFALADASAPPVPAGAEPVAVCIDCVGDRPLAVKSYDAFADGPGRRAAAVPDTLGVALETLPYHPINGTRRYMVATRHAPGGALVGHKLLWMTEVQRPELRAWAWDQVDAWRARWGAASHPAVASAFDALRRGWAHLPDTFLYPDLVCLNASRASPTTLIVYVSIR